MNDRKKRLKKERKKTEKKKENKKSKSDELNEEDYYNMDLDELVSSSSSSEDEDTYILLSDSDEQNNQTHQKAQQLFDINSSINSLQYYVSLTLVKYPGTGELFMIITGQDEKKDQIELFRTDFANCINIEKNKIDTDFTIYFENIQIVFRADDYEKTRKILISLRQFFETHSNNIQPELPPPPDTVVTNQMKLFFGGL